MKTFKDYVNRTIHPGDDFYHYANEKWLAEQGIPDQEFRWGSFDILAEQNFVKLKEILENLNLKADITVNSEDQKLRDFYNSAMNSEQAEKTGLIELKEVFNEIDLTENLSGLSRLLGSLTLRGLAMVFAPYVDVDDKNTQQYLLRLTQHGLGLPDRDYYISADQAMEKIRNSYLLHLDNLFKLLPESKSLFSEKVFDFEKNLAEASMTATERRDVEATYNKMSFEQLKEKYSRIDWSVYFDALMGKMPIEVSVDQPAFVEKVNELFEMANLKDWKMYLKRQAFRNLSVAMGEKYELLQFDFYGKIINGAKEIKPRWKRVVRMLNDSITDPLAKLFVEKYFSPLAKSKMEELVEDLRKAFGQRIEKLPWMAAETKTKALAKLKKAAVKIGYPDKWIDFNALEIKPASYAKNLIAAAVFENQRQFAKLGKVIDRTEWLMSPATVNAYANLNMNEIVFPAGILQPPFFDLNADAALNYGGIGSVIAHELTHGFDDNGSQFDQNGNLSNWRTVEDKVNFDMRAKILERQADNFEILPNLYINGGLTLGENIADLGGVEIAFEAFKLLLIRTQKSEPIDGFSAEQRFFLNAARVEASNQRPEFIRRMVVSDPHSPSIFRVNAIFRNCQAFYDAFDLDNNKKMYLDPKERASIW